MIRPFTCVCVLLAAGSGLYLYQTKHRTLMLDRQISDVLRQADEARARTAVLKAEYSTLSDPGRLTDLSARFLALKPSMPTQYVQLADLDARLPPVEAFPKPGDAPAPVAPAAGTTDMDDDALQDALAQPVVAAAQPVAGPVVAAVAGPGLRDSGAPAAAAVHDATRVAQASPVTPRTIHRAAPVGTQYASNLHPPAARAVAAEHPHADGPRAESSYAAYAPPVYRAPIRPASASVSSLGMGGSLLGQSSSMTLAAPVPVAN